MRTKSHTRSGALLTEVILETFRLNGRLLSAGDKLVEPLGLTSARWQVLGAIHSAPSPQPVSWLARNRGLKRQGVQRIVNELESEGLVSFESNPHHRRAKLVVFTKAGRKAYDAATERQIEWVNRLSRDIGADEMKCALEVMGAMLSRLEAAPPTD